LFGIGALSLTGCVADPPPRIVALSPTSSEVRVDWQPPVLTPSPITGYRVDARLGTTTVATTTVGAGVFSTTFTGLTSGVTYQFIVTGLTGRGDTASASGAATPNPHILWEWGQVICGSGETFAIHNAPSYTGTDRDFVKVASTSVAGSHILAITVTGELWAWGDNSFGQLGVGGTTRRLTPTRVGTDSDWSAVATGYAHTLALKTDGSLWSWGFDGVGQLGHGVVLPEPPDEPRKVLEPTRVLPGTFDWKFIAAGDGRSLAIRGASRTLWHWGVDVGTSPVQLGISTGWDQVSAGVGQTDYVLGLKTDHTMWSWGREVPPITGNESGQLGQGDTNAHPAPTKIGTETDWASISAGGTHGLARKTDGRLFAWGDNNGGQLGIGTIGGNVLTPTQVGTDSDWVYADAGAGVSLAIKNNGTLHAWGYNNCAALGIGQGPDNAARPNPEQVGVGQDWRVVEGANGTSYGIRGTPLP
jgi:alpha-tubulin suppressor-like RCC1 family protein